jgi:ATP-dependent DNA ligase
MLGRRVDELPDGDWVYEPKWDGFRCIAFRTGGEVDLRSRHDRPLARYFPELVAGLRELGCERFVLDGEIVVPGPSGLNFDDLLARVHPAAPRVERLSRETPAVFVAFDLVAREGEDLRSGPSASAAFCWRSCFAEPRPLFGRPPSPTILGSRPNGSRWRAGA